MAHFGADVVQMWCKRSGGPIEHGQKRAGHLWSFLSSPYLSIMAALRPRWPLTVLVSLMLASSVAAACGSNSDDSIFIGDDGGSSSSSSSSSGSSSGFGDVDGTAPNGDPFAVTPANPTTITVPAGTHTPTVVFTATAKGAPAAVKWQLDRGDIGTITPGPSETGTFVPSGNVGGAVNLTAFYGAQILKRAITVKITGQQNGATAGQSSQVATTLADLTAGGGIGGVGGEGLGAGVTDAATLAALAAPAGNGSTQNLVQLYPYDKTVWPRGILAPLLQWRWATDDADAIRIELASQSGSYAWTGTFAKPAILTTTGGKFARHPIPQDVWAAATSSAGGADNLTVKLTIAKAGIAYGPIVQTWTVAAARLSGTIYYNSYGTNLAKNFGGAVGGDHRFGGAVLSIRVGDQGPKLVAGGDGNDAQCRVCHSVAGGGSRLIVQKGDNYAATSNYTLAANGTATESALTSNNEFAAITHDGSKMLTADGTLRALPDDATPLPSSGLTTITSNIGPAAFSIDSTLVAFNANGAPLANPKKKLGVMKFNAATGAFSDFLAVVDDSAEAVDVRPGWPAFTPDGKSVVFHHQSVAGIDGNSASALNTRKGAKAQIHLASTTATGFKKLEALNGVGAGGTSYLPKLDTPSTVTCTGDGSNVSSDADHADDTNLNYEPTVNPVSSGGYAWVVFTSRRMYGNVATIPPFCSDPRGVDLISNITTKKLWVAAIDLNAPAGTDASHPGFYLPAQELLAGNARGFWVQDPCRADGNGCESGDQCCNGYCKADGDAGALICSNTAPTCASNGDKCKVSGDCCDPGAACIGGFCALPGPPH